MPEKRTVLILGAGASKDAADFPTGQELRHTICQGLRNSGETLFMQLKEIGFPQTDLSAFRRHLKYSNCNSVDEFLQTNEHWEEIGKAAMAAILLKHERGTTWEEAKPFHTDPQAYNWYRELTAKLFTNGLDTLDNCGLSIITFNYDRSLEHCLFESAINRYCMNRVGVDKAAEQKCMEKIAAIPIVHVYGSLGRLSWQKSGQWAANESLEYGDLINKLTIQKCVSNIRIIGEADKKAEEDLGFIEARKQINQAIKLFFLGFGYNATNISRLQLGLMKRFERLEGTSMSLTDTQRRRIDRDLFQGRCVLFDVRDTVQAGMAKKKGDLNCLDFIRHMGVL